MVTFLGSSLKVTLDLPLFSSDFRSYLTEDGVSVSVCVFSGVRTASRIIKRLRISVNIRYTGSSLSKASKSYLTRFFWLCFFVDLFISSSQLGRKSREFQARICLHFAI